jgi:hypothetical protein
MTAFPDGILVSDTPPPRTFDLRPYNFSQTSAVSLPARDLAALNQSTPVEEAANLVRFIDLLSDRILRIT